MLPACPKTFTAPLHDGRLPVKWLSLTMKNSGKLSPIAAPMLPASLLPLSSRPLSLRATENWQRGSTGVERYGCIPQSAANNLGDIPRKWELQNPCFEGVSWGGNTLGLVPDSLPHSLGYAWALYAPTPPLQRTDEYACLLQNEIGKKEPRKSLPRPMNRKTLRRIARGNWICGDFPTWNLLFPIRCARPGAVTWGAILSISGRP